MKILVTGAAGFIGSHAAEQLALMGHEVTGIDNFAPYYDVQLKIENANVLYQQNINLVHADLRDDRLHQKIGTGFDHIFHFAAQPGISPSVSFDDYLQNNIVATQKLLEFAKQHNNLRLFTNISTSSVYGTDATCSEEKAPEPISHYGITKLAAEQLALQQSRCGNFNACSLRLYSVYGPRERPDKLFTKLIHSALKGEPFHLYQGSEQHVRSFTYVGDIVKGVTAVIGRETECNGQLVNLGNEQEYTTQQGIDCVEALTGGHIPINHSGKRSGDQLRTKALIDKAASLLGYRPATTLAEGLQQQIAWQKNRHIYQDRYLQFKPTG